jgi:ABC-2 type transport system permease protein
MLSMIVLTATVFSLAGLINAIFAKSFDDVTIVPTFVLTPLTYLGGVFYSISMLSPFWQQVSLINPVLYMVNGFRYGVLGISDMSIWISYSVLAVFILGFGGFAMYLLNRGVGTRT